MKFLYGLYNEKDGDVPKGTLVAVGGFSGPRVWDKNGKTIKSYEWVRFASLPNARVAGGMGKLLDTFIQDVKPDDIMSYADKNLSSGEVYRKLGFVEEGEKEFSGGVKSLKFRLKLTDW